MAPSKPQTRLRARSERSRDPRTSRTRAAVLASVAVLHARGDIVTVSAIVRESGISRSAFYAHFSGLPDVATTIMRTALNEISDTYEAGAHADVDAEAEALHDSQRRLVEHFAENRQLYLAVASLPVGRDVHLDTVRVLSELILRTITRRQHVPHGIDHVLAARYIASAALGLLEAWISGEIDADPREIASHLTRLMPQWLSGLEPVKPAQ